MGDFTSEMRHVIYHQSKMITDNEIKEEDYIINFQKALSIQI
jgi:hypothetical protein